MGKLTLVIEDLCLRPLPEPLPLREYPPGNAHLVSDKKGRKLELIRKLPEYTTVCNLQSAPRSEPNGDSTAKPCPMEGLI